MPFFLGNIFFFFFVKINTCNVRMLPNDSGYKSMYKCISGLSWHKRHRTSKQKWMDEWPFLYFILMHDQLVHSAEYDVGNEPHIISFCSFLYLCTMYPSPFAEALFEKKSSEIGPIKMFSTLRTSAWVKPLHIFMYCCASVLSLKWRDNEIRIHACIPIYHHNRDIH